MPPRIVCAAIVLVWLGFNGWLFFRDLLPRMLPGQPPPYVIDLVEETKTKRPYVEWIVNRNNEKAFRARTFVVQQAHDVFELNSTYVAPFGKPPSIRGIRIEQMTTTYHVNTLGDLLGVSVEIKGQPQLAEALKIVVDDFTATIEGSVNNGQLTPRLTLKIPGRTFKRDLPSVSIPRGNSLLIPLHPVNRVQGISLGQSWTLHLFDPIASSLSALGTSSGSQFLRAKVRPRIERFSYGRRQNVECLVIDYEGDDIKASTWVARERGLVLCQELFFDNEHWATYRD